MESFRQRRMAQVQSPLLRLPAEMRVKILRNILKSDQPLYSMEKYRHESPKNFKKVRRLYYAQLRLSSQFLCTCQQVKDEGEQVLYGENVLCILYRCDMRWDSRVSHGSIGSDCHILRWSTKLPKIDCAMEDHMSQSRGPGSDLHCWNPCLCHNFKEDMPYAAPDSTRFHRVRVDLHYNDIYAIFTASRSLFPLLENKSVLLQAIPDSQSSDLEPDKNASLLRACRVFRCQSLKVDCSLLRDVDLDEIAAIERVVGSEESVDDYHKDYLEFVEDVIPKLIADPWDELSHIDSFQDSAIELLADLETAVYEYDSERYRITKQEIITAARLWLEEWTGSMCADVEMVKKQAMKKLDRA